MGVLYIIVRNFPWWAIPLGLSLILETFRKDQGGKNKSGLKKTLLFASGLVLILGSVAFLYFSGHRYAVPFLHEMFKEAL